MSTTNNVNKRLHQDIVDFTSYIRPTPSEIIVRNVLFNAVEKIIRRAVSANALYSVELFGSSKIGLGLPGGDLDIAVITKENYSDSRMHKRLAFRLADYLRSSGIVHTGFSNDTDDEQGIQVNHFAPVPVVKCRSLSRWGNIPIDISFAQGQSSKSAGTLVASIIQTNLESQPALAPLVLVVKTFLKQRGLGSAASGGLGSYPLIVMIISFLQLNPLNLPPAYISNPFDPGIHSLGRLLADFFVYYGSLFPYGEKYISIAPAGTNANQNINHSSSSSHAASNVFAAGSSLRYGAKSSSMKEAKIVTREERVDVKTTPGPVPDSELGGLKPRAGVTWIKNTTYEKIAIQCVVDPENDIGKGTSRMKNVVAAFKEATTTLLQFRDQDRASDILGKIVQLSEKAIAHRAHIERIVGEDKIGRFITAEHSGHTKKRPRETPLPPPKSKKNKSTRLKGEENFEPASKSEYSQKKKLQGQRGKRTGNQRADT